MVRHRLGRWAPRSKCSRRRLLRKRLCWRQGHAYAACVTQAARTSRFSPHCFAQREEKQGRGKRTTTLTRGRAPRSGRAERRPAGSRAVPPVLRRREGDEVTGALARKPRMLWCFTRYLRARWVDRSRSESVLEEANKKYARKQFASFKSLSANFIW